MNRQGSRKKYQSGGKIPNFMSSLLKVYGQQSSPIINTQNNLIDDKGMSTPEIRAGVQADQVNQANYNRYISNPRAELAQGIGRKDLPKVNAYNPTRQYNQFTPPSSSVQAPSNGIHWSTILEGLNVGARAWSEQYARARDDNYTNSNLANPLGGILPYNDGQSDDVKYGYNNFKSGGINIKPENRGKFTAYKQRTGKTTEEALHSPNAHVRAMANFARNAVKWHHQEGGSISEQGYRDDSKYRNRKSIDIHTPNGLIDMSHTSIPLIANGRHLSPYSGMHQFNTNVVTETPAFQIGGTNYALDPINKDRDRPDLKYDYNSINNDPWLSTPLKGENYKYNGAIGWDGKPIRKLTIGKAIQVNTDFFMNNMPERSNNYLLPNTHHSINIVPQRIPNDNLAFAQVGGTIPADNFTKGWMNSPKYNEMLRNSGGASIAQARMDNLNNATVATVPHKSIQFNRGVFTRGRTDENGNVQVSDRLDGYSNYLTTNHELSHAVDRGKLIPQIDANKLGIDATEGRAKLNSVRALGKLKGVYDPYNENINKDQFHQLLKEDSRDLKDLINKYGENGTFEMLNSISSSKSTDDLQVAKKGGRMGKYQRGGIGDVVKYIYGDDDKKQENTFKKNEKGATDENTAPDEEEQARIAEGTQQYNDAMNVFNQHQMLQEQQEQLQAQQAMMNKNPYESQAQQQEEHPLNADELSAPQLLNRIGGTEGGRVGQGNNLGTSARGTYQIIDATREAIRKQFFSNMSHEEFENKYNTDPGFERQVALAHLTDLNHKFGNRGATKAWYTGNPNYPENQIPGGVGTKNKITAGQYVNQTLGHYQTGGSIVDYLNNQGQASDKESRAKLAELHGVNNYDFSAEKNTELLNKLRNTTINTPNNYQGDFKSAFRSARSMGDNNFTWNGKTYNTNLAPTPSTSLSPSMRDSTLSSTNPTPITHTPIDMSSFYSNFKNIKSAARDYLHIGELKDRPLQSGWIVDRATGKLNIIKNSKAGTDIRVITGKGVDSYINPNKKEEILTHDEQGTVPGYYNVLPAGEGIPEEDKRVFKNRMRDLRPIAAEGHPASGAHGLTLYSTASKHRGDFQNFTPNQYIDRARENGTHGCIGTNCDDKAQFDMINASNPLSDTLRVFDSRSKEGKAYAALYGLNRKCGGRIGNIKRAK